MGGSNLSHSDGQWAHGSSTAGASTNHASQSLQPSSLPEKLQLLGLGAVSLTTAQPTSTTALASQTAPTASNGKDAGGASQPLPGLQGNANESHAAGLQGIEASLHAQTAAASGRNTAQKAGPSQSAAWKTSINPFTGQPYAYAYAYAYMPTA